MPQPTNAKDSLRFDYVRHMLVKQRCCGKDSMQTDCKHMQLLCHSLQVSLVVLLDMHHKTSADGAFMGNRSDPASHPNVQYDFYPCAV